MSQATDMKIKLMMVAAVEANSAADALERIADACEGKFNPPFAETYRDTAYLHRIRARKLIRCAATLADFTPEEMALLDSDMNLLQEITA